MATIVISAKQMMDANLGAIALTFVVPVATLVLRILVWKAAYANGTTDTTTGMSLDQLLTYTLMSAVFFRQMNIYTPATTALWEGSIINRYTRPMRMFTSLASETIGRSWIPTLLVFSLPLLMIAPMVGIRIAAHSVGFGMIAVVSMILSIIVGFALDFIFAAIAIRLKNGCWAAQQIRSALAMVLTGQLVPFAMFPRPVRILLELLPFGAVANAPLSIYVGTTHVSRLLLLQSFWAVTLCIVAMIAFSLSQERMISLGG